MRDERPVADVARAVAFAHAPGCKNDNQLAKAPPSGPPRPGAARRKAGPWRAQLASTPGRDAALSGGAASPLERLQSVHYGPPSDQTPTRKELFIYADLGSSIAAIVDSPHNAAAPPAQPDMPNTAYNVGYDGIDHPLWLSRHTGLIYTELDTVGNVRRLHADSILHAEGATGDLGGYSYSAFGKSIAPSAPGGLPDPSVSQPFRWQGKRLIAANLYDSRARTWSADLGAFLQPDEYVFLSRGGTLWSWPRQNPMRWRDPSGRDASEWFLGHAGWIDDVAPALAAAGAESGVPGLAQVGEAALLAINAIDAVSALDAQRQSAVAIAKATSDDGEECDGESSAKADHREKTRGANKSDRKQIDAAARQAGVDDRNGFGDFVESEKKAMGRRGSENFTYDELLDLAEQFKSEGGG